ncbi:hypothetical protein HYS96_04780 [Candidatus Daviesbacteria bacterium]|nr:hypothetical protein [Candidatus Daviesbacteria bacterium]
MFRRKNNNSKRNLLKKIFIFALFILILLAIYFFFNSSLFKIKNISLKTESLDCLGNNEEIKKDSEIVSQNTIFFNSKNVEKKLKNKFYCIKTIIFAKKFPNGMELTIIGRKAEAKLIPLPIYEATASSNLENIATPSATDIFLVDGEGKVFSKGDLAGDLPIILIYKGSLNLGENLGVYIINALKILNKIGPFGIDSKLSKIATGEFLVTGTVPKIIFKLTEQIDIQLASLQLILEQAKIDQSRLEFIDLRFDKPVVRFAPKKNG